ncbi:molecular chaperone [Solibacillus silvestris]|uniref:molecular chaperone n=1 Tax=Solibacillus silvestris TaxID=76853 RepID=UPI003F8238AB
MSKLSRLIEQIEMAQTLLSLQMEREQLRMKVEHLTNLLGVHQKVSLAETRSQVKNTCSHISRTNEENLIH